ncbi:MAG: exosome complex RNA-binding protein Csl4 [Crenarchaeota archaeon]|nr:exosome complex RNA-binding protein Csl4 [Thermoproteota archaeon]MDW8034454.1 exosome complex RNA-binding protein Csl4 [Nitrososphaerota archaeon]
MKSLQDRLVVVGEPLATLEEFFPGEGTFEEKGIIYSSIIGRVLIDKHKRELGVIPFKTLLVPKPGFRVIGMVTGFSNHYANVEIFCMNGVKLDHEYTGVIGRESLGKSHSRFRGINVRTYVSENDMVYGIVISTVNTILLDISYREYGVVKAYCKFCGNTLVLSGKGLFCPLCRNNEKRKISIFYGESIERLVSRT